MLHPVIFSLGTWPMEKNVTGVLSGHAWGQYSGVFPCNTQTLRLTASFCCKQRGRPQHRRAVGAGAAGGLAGLGKGAGSQL